MNFIFEKLYNKFVYRPNLKRKLKRVGKEFKLGYCSEVLNPQFFTIGNFFYCGPFAYFGTNKNNPVVIGDYVMFGPKCSIQGGNHDVNFEGFMYQNTNIEHKQGEIKVGNGAWFGSNCTIISGADVGEGSIIGAMSLVNKKIPPFVIAGGVPVKVIKPRFKNITQIQNTLRNTQSDYSLDEILELHKNIGFNYPR